MFKCKNANRVQMQAQFDRECACPAENNEAVMAAACACDAPCRPARLFGQKTRPFTAWEQDVATAWEKAS